MILAKDATYHYAYTAAWTAGVFKSYQLLLERALVHGRRALESGDLAARNQAQDIIVQIQRGLNTSLPAGIWLFEMLGIIWDVLEAFRREEVERALDLLAQLRELLREAQKLEP